MGEQTSEQAEQGSVAHRLVELKIGLAVGKLSESEYKDAVDDVLKHPMYSKEMERLTEIHKDFCVERYHEALALSKDAAILLEQRLDFSPWVPMGFGTSDTIIIADSVLEIIDYKHGQGIPVSAERNGQMMLYALGAVNHFGALYDLETIVMTISQPRLDKLSTYEMSVEALLEFAEQELKPKAAFAFQGLGQFYPSLETCRFCKVKSTCRARSEQQLELTKMDFQLPALLTDDEVVKVLSQVDELMAWARDIQRYALEEAVHKQKCWPGMKLVEGRGSRKYTDEKAVATALTAAGYDSDVIYKKSLQTITTLEKELGKKEFSELLGSFITKTPGKIKLAFEDDKRPEIKTSPEVDFQ